MRTAATLIISLAMALGAIGLAVAAPGGNRRPASADVQNASGAIAIANSHAGQALLDVEQLRPGDAAQGSVTIGNAGDIPGAFAVDLSGMQDVPGAYGGRLSNRLQLTLVDVTHARVLYAGTPAALRPLDLGRFAAHESREYLLAATLPDGGLDGSDNPYQGARLSLGLVWSATAVPAATPTPTPKPRPTPTPTPTPTKPKPPVTPPPAVTPPLDLASALGLPPATKCVKKHKLKFKLKAPDGAKPKSAKVAVNGKVKLRVKGRKVRKAVTLKKLRRTTTVKLTVKASNRRTYTASRTYSACAKRAP